VIKRHVTTRTLRLLFCVLVFCVLVCLAYWSYLQTIRTGSACQTCLSDFSEKSAA
jgi:Tfp pilus assembly protein PilO